MARYLIQINKSDDKVKAFFIMPNAVENSDFFLLDVSQGTDPIIGNAFGTTYEQKRKSDYKLEADELYMEWRASVDADVDTQAIQDAKKLAWTDKRDAIKTRYPNV